MQRMIEKGFLSGFQATNITDTQIFEEILAFDLEKQYSPSKFVVGVLCEESSSRTRFSTESILYKLGANVIHFGSLQETSIHKGESLQKSAILWSGYFDLIAIRSKNDYLPFIFNKYATIPVINLGDGANEHPTQGLATLVHAYKIFGRIKDLNICLWGDFQKSRTAHTVAIMFSLLGANVYIYSVPKLKLPCMHINLIKQFSSCSKIEVIDSLDDHKVNMDIFYINRLQTERWDILPQYAKFDVQYCEKLSPEGIILHPLPHNDEISDDVIYHTKSKIYDHIKITTQTRAWLLYNYKYAFENGTAMHNNSAFLEGIYKDEY
jgi:aspartate carbamoyltransferase catalytic subunit